MIANPSKFMDICSNPNFEDYPEVKNLRVAWTRGSPNTEEQMQFYRSKLPKTHVMNAIGCTEMSMMIAYFDAVKEYELNKSKVWSVGRLNPGVQAKVNVIFKNFFPNLLKYFLTNRLWILKQEPNL